MPLWGDALMIAARGNLSNLTGVDALSPSDAGPAADQTAKLRDTPRSGVTEARNRPGMRRRPCAAPGLRSNDVLLPFGERPDGSIVHIGDVPSGLACECTCPGCGGTLVAHKGGRKEHHFQHHSSAACQGAYETALHKLAKQILDRELNLVVPPAAFGDGDDEVIESPGGRFTFDRAELEIPFPGFQPDVVLYRGARRLLVEIMVTHATGPEKLERIAAHGIAAIEIDLGGLHRRADEATVTKALCIEAPRQWLHNERLERARERWEANEAEKERRAEEARRRKAQENERRFERQARQIAQALAVSGVPGPRNSHHAAIEEADLLCCVDLAVPGDGCFSVPRSLWQSAVIAAIVLAPMKRQPFAYRQEGIHPAGLLIEGPLKAMVKRGIPAFLKPDEAAAMAQRIEGFIPPYQVLKDYLAELGRRGILGERAKKWFVTTSCWTAVEDARETSQRRKEHKDAIRELVEELVGSLPESERRGFSIADWLQRPVPGTDLPPSGHLDDEADDLISALRGIAAMLAGHGPVIEAHLGLPVDFAMTRERRRRQDLARQAAAARQAQIEIQRERERREALAQAHGREKQLEGLAREALGSDAETWLGTAIDCLGGLSPREAARQGALGLGQAAAAVQDILEQRERERRTNVLRERLFERARSNAKPDHARAFLQSAQPRLRGQRPIDYCTDEPSFDLVVRLMEEAVRHYRK